MRPNILSKLKHNRLLSKSTFPTFVETFNYAVNRIDNLVGDRDVNPQSGSIHVDNSDPEHPVIRFNGELSGGASNHTGDANLSSHGLSSILLSSDNQYQLFEFDLSGTHHNLTSSDISSDVELVVRDNKNKCINYIPPYWLSCSQVSSDYISGDADVNPIKWQQRSIDLIGNGDKSYYELYEFGEAPGFSIDPIQDKNQFEFVVRYHATPVGRDEVKYVTLNLSSISPISGDANIIGNLQNSIMTIGDGFGNVWHELYGLGDTGVISATMAYDGDDHYIMNEGNSWTNPNKQFLYYDYLDKRLKYGDICLYMPKVKASDLDDDVLPEISTVIIPEISTIISAELSAQLSALDDRYWIKGEDNTENYGSSIGNSNKNLVIDLDNKQLHCSTSIEHWSTGSLYADYDLKAQVVEATQFIKIGNTTLTESQLQQLLALINNP